MHLCGGILFSSSGITTIAVICVELLMVNKNIEYCIRKSTKWTVATEVLGKLITPVTGAILAHILTPEAFGIVAAILVVTSFAEMFADAGFQKYFVQHDFCDEKENRMPFVW